MVGGLCYSIDVLTVPIIGVDITEGERIWVPPSPGSQITLMGFHLWAQDELHDFQTILLIEEKGVVLAVAAPSQGGTPIHLPRGISLEPGMSIIATLTMAPQKAPAMLYGMLWGTE